jgi:hypothetical protein
MIRSFYRTAAILLALYLSLLAHGRLPVSADGEDPRLEIGADRLRPGMILQVRGVNLAREASIPISLVGAEGEFALGVITSSETGEFTQSLVLPSDLPDGTYRVLARIPGAVAVVSAPVRVQGPPVVSNEDEQAGGQREQAEQLLRPIATGLPVSAGPTVLPITGPSRVDSPAWPAGLALSVFALAAVGLAVLEWRRRRRQHAAPAGRDPLESR